MLQKDGPNLTSFLQPWQRGRDKQCGSSVPKQPEQAQNNKLDKEITVSLSQRSTCVWIQQRHVNKLSWLPAHPNKTNLSLIILVTAFDSITKVLHAFLKPLILHLMTRRSEHPCCLNWLLTQRHTCKTPKKRRRPPSQTSRRSPSNTGLSAISSTNVREGEAL